MNLTDEQLAQKYRSTIKAYSEGKEADFKYSDVSGYIVSKHSGGYYFVVTLKNGNTKKFTATQNNVRFQITSEQFKYWENNIWPQDQKKGIRLGQSYTNSFYGFQHPEFKGTTCPELFYEEDKKRAKEMVYSCTNFTDE